MTERKKQIYQLIAVSTVLLLILLMTVFAPWIAPYDPTAVNMEHRLLAPCQAHPLGTDALGRDVLSRVIYGGRASLLLAVIATCCSMGLGLAIGIAAGYCEGITDTIITGISNVFQGLPSTILMIALVGILGSNNYSIVFALVLTSWVGFSRLVRGEVLKVKQEPYIEKHVWLRGKSLAHYLEAYPAQYPHQSHCAVYHPRRTGRAVSCRAQLSGAWDSAADPRLGRND